MGLSQYLEGHSNPDLPETLRFPATYLSFWRKKIGLWVVHFAAMSLVAAMLESREKKSAVKKCEHTSLLSIELSRFCAFLETKKQG